MANIFITGIGTDVGKTVVATIVTEALEADYFKPVQAGDLDNSDTMKVENLISNTRSVFHPNSYALKTPMSPHAAAEIDGILIDTAEIKLPQTENHLVIEGAGGILVPLNEKETILDIIDPKCKVIVVSRHYLGSINHSLMTIQLLQAKGLDMHLIFNGDEHPSTEAIIKTMGNVSVIGRIDEEVTMDKTVIKKYADKFKNKLSQIIAAE